MAKVLIGCFLGALAMFLWGFVYWSLLPTSSSIFSDAPNEAALADELKALPQSGTYYVPAASLMTADAEEFNRRHEAGPVATLFVYREGRPAMSAGTMSLGFLNMLVSVLVMGLVLKLAAPALQSYGLKVGFVLAVGLVGVVISDLGSPIWWAHPWNLYIFNAIFHTTSWLFVGLILGKMVQTEA